MPRNDTWSLVLFAGLTIQYSSKLFFLLLLYRFVCFKFLLYALTRQSTGFEKREQVTLSPFVCLFFRDVIVFSSSPNHFFHARFPPFHYCVFFFSSYFFFLFFSFFFIASHGLFTRFHAVLRVYCLICIHIYIYIYIYMYIYMYMWRVVFFFFWGCSIQFLCFAWHHCLFRLFVVCLP